MGENFDLIKQIGSFFIIALMVFTFTTVSRVVIMRVVVYFFPCLSCEQKNTKVDLYQCDTPEQE